MPSTPVASGGTYTLSAGQSRSLASLFTYYDLDNDIVSFAVKDREIGGGYLTKDGVRQAENQLFDPIPIGEISRWAFVAGPAGSTSNVGFQANDSRGTYNLTAAVATVNVAGIVVTPHDPTATGGTYSMTAGQSRALSSMFTSSDLDNDVTAFAVRDRELGGGYLTKDGIHMTDASLFDAIPISELSRWAYVAGAAGSTGTVGFNAIDSRGAYSSSATATVNVIVVDTFDAGNTLATATTLAIGATIGQSVGVGTDVDDYFKFVASASGHVTANLTGLSADIDLRALNSAGTTIVSSFLGGTANETLGFDVVAGQTYYLRVDPYGLVSSNYSLTTSFSTVPNADAGNTLATATTLAIGATIGQSVGVGTDVDDYFKFVASASGRVTANLTGLSADIDLRALNSAGSVILSSAAAGTANETLGFDVVAGQTYYLHVDPYGLRSSNYNLTTSFSKVLSNAEQRAVDIRDSAMLANLAYNNNPGVDAGGGWSLLSRNQLGLTQTQWDNNSGDTTNSQFVFDIDDGQAIVSQKGSTLAISFRGSEALGDFLADIVGGLASFAPHFALFNDLISSVDAYAASHGITNVLVAGHSLGGAMVEMYMSQHPNTSTISYSGVSFGSPGEPFSNNTPGSDPRLLNIGHSGDPVYRSATVNTFGIDIEVNLPSEADLSLLGLIAKAAQTAGGDIGEHSGLLYNTTAIMLTLSGTLFERFIANPSLYSATILGSGNFSAGGLNDYIIGGFDASQILGGLGNDLIFGNTGNDFLYGQTGSDWLDGGRNDDRLYGGAGNDVLTGGSGRDTFVFTTALGVTNIDSIKDFSVVDDTISLSLAIFTAAGPLGQLLASAFNSGAAATDADDRIIYNSSTGALIYDSNGNMAGGAVQFASLGTGIALTAADFFLF